MAIDPNVQQRDIQYLSKAIDDMAKAVARLEGKLDGMAQSYARKEEVDKEHVRLEKEVEKLDTKLSTRIDDLEKDVAKNTNGRWKLVGMGVLATILIPILTAVVLKSV